MQKTPKPSLSIYTNVNITVYSITHKSFKKRGLFTFIIGKYVNTEKSIISPPKSATAENCRQWWVSHSYKSEDAEHQAEASVGSLCVRCVVLKTQLLSAQAAKKKKKPTPLFDNILCYEAQPKNQVITTG